LNVSEFWSNIDLGLVADVSKPRSTELVPYSLDAMTEDLISLKTEKWPEMDPEIRVHFQGDAATVDSSLTYLQELFQGKSKKKAIFVLEILHLYRDFRRQVRLSPAIEIKEKAWWYYWEPERFAKFAELDELEKRRRRVADSSGGKEHLGGIPMPIGSDEGGRVVYGGGGKGGLNRGPIWPKKS
jgi:hypothetical protein